MRRRAPSAPGRTDDRARRGGDASGRSYRRFDWRSARRTSASRARTVDGWNLALYRYRPRGTPRPLPVLCGHGMAGTHLIYDLHPDYSLARYLAGQGFDTWLVDLRGRGDSWPDGGPDRSACSGPSTTSPPATCPPPSSACARAAAPTRCCGSAWR